MKFKSMLFIVLLSLCSCKDKPSNATIKSVDYSKEKLDVTTSVYPENISKVFDAHGGVDRWKTMQTLSFTMPKPTGNEITLTDLNSRAELIETPIYTLGFDGHTHWVDEKDGYTYEGNAKFYRGLMMYFYAMPFILSDDGIIYEDTRPLAFEGKTYPGIKISYEAGVGSSPNDDYIIYYDEASGEMQWLAYTVTFGKDEKNEDFHFIRYNSWQTINGLRLPKSIDWYEDEENQPTTKRNTVVFTDVVISENRPEASVFIKPESAKLIE